MEEMILKFLDYLQYERYRSACTVENYGRDLKAFVAYVDGLEVEKSWDAVDSDIIRNWVADMMDKGNLPTSVSRRLSSLRTFYKFAMARGLVEKDATYNVKAPKKAKPLPQYLREEEIDRLLDNDNFADGYEGLLSRTIILTFYTTGIRLSELIGLKDSSVDFGSRMMKVLGKRNKERIIPFGEELGESIADYQSQRNKLFGNSHETLFLSKKGEPMTAQQVRRLVQTGISKVSTLKKRSPHVLRHTFATAMLNHESDLESVQKLLGHESLVTTEIYTHTTFEQLRKAYSGAHPREKK